MMFKAIVAAIVGSMIAFSGEALKTNLETHEWSCVRNSDCYTMRNCDWRITKKHNSIWKTDTGNYYPYCSISNGGRCECRRCNDNQS